MLLTFKMRNGNGAHQKPCQKTYLLFPNISLPLTSLPVNFKHSSFQASSLPNDRVRRKKVKILVDLLNVLFSNTQLPLTSLPVNCRHVPFQATSLQNHGELLTAIGSVMYCVVRLSALYMDQKRAWVEHATYLPNDRVRRRK